MLSIFFAFAPVASAAGHAVVSISTEAGAEHGATTTVPIIADDEGSNMSLGQSTIIVTFDPSVVHVTEVATGSENALTVVASNIQNGWVKLASVDGSVAHNGTVIIANVTFEAVGYPPDTCQLTITVETLGDWYDYSDITHTVNNGTFTVTATSAFDTNKGTYPSIMGTHEGKITPNKTIVVHKMYTYPCAGTGGHTKSIKVYENGTLIANGTWDGYHEDWHNITLHNVTDGTHYVMLLQDHEYNYTIRTGSYPQILHAASKEVTGGTITCTSFVDANGKTYTDWIPAIKFFW